MNTLTKALISASGLTLASVSHAQLVISEYVEGSGYNKALELYNSGTDSVSLSEYELIRYVNGSTTSSYSISLGEDSILAGATYILVENKSNTDDALKAKADRITSLNFNGNDPIALKKDDVVVDFFGDYSGSNFAKDKTYARTDLTLLADGEWRADSWNVLAKNDFSGLGIAPDGTVTEPVVFSCEGQSLTPIYSIQGSGEVSPLTGEDVYTTGIVTQIVSSLYKGVFIQDSIGDGDNTTSDGLFVFSSNIPSDVEVGDEICVLGNVKEYYNLTELVLKDDSVEVLSKGNVVASTPMELSGDALLHDQLEKYEGMLVSTTDSELVVTRPFSFDYDSYRNNMVLSYQSPLYKSTHLYIAGSEEEQQLAQDNMKGALFVDTDAKAPNGVVPYFSDFNAEDGYIRIGDEVQNLEGVISYSYSQYRLIPTADENLAKSDFEHTFTDRTGYGPELSQQGDLRIASFNVLNLFNSPFNGAENPFGDNRGAESLEDYNLQLTKIATAISLLDADIVGLMEIENNGFDENSAIAALVDAINTTQSASAAPYEFIKADAGYVGSDAIAVGLIYRPSVVKPKKTPVLIEMPEQHGLDADGNQFDKYQRTALLQTFKHRRSRERISVVVNHFKSKGSGCIEDSNAQAAGPQSNCNAFRVSAAVALGDYLERNVRGKVMILGDLNSYGKEDPIRVLTNYNAFSPEFPIYTAEQATLNGAQINNGDSVEVTRNYGFTNLVPHFQGDKAFSYTYNGELGGLDHALANWQLMKHVVDADDWHINSAESNLLEYSSEFTGDLAKSNNAYSSSDHDPVVVELRMSHWKPWHGGHHRPWHLGHLFGYSNHNSNWYHQPMRWGWWR
ncbi:ExeM/NucH family extracellular endonuclease [Marinomonas balearica]|uniref:LTD domain-containing protein n=1 Tax=Marinomonas balearica TaxID=491947 RepID=A0A4R6MCR5_9GAMM|nr:ExeM/NucH family extracellular endonuclease [Marinomonas balearica]TDO99447.1 hypothetical protein DFP79_0429 [Marinomonas balearica]